MQHYGQFQLALSNPEGMERTDAKPGTFRQYLELSGYTDKHHIPKTQASKELTVCVPLVPAGLEAEAEDHQAISNLARL